jgi:hypothetical protein
MRILAEKFVEEPNIVEEPKVVDYDDIVVVVEDLRKQCMNNTSFNITRMIER